MPLTLIDVLENYDALAARVPLHQWRIHDEKDTACTCDYVVCEQALAMAKRHRPDATIHPLRRAAIDRQVSRNPCPVHLVAAGGLRAMTERTSDGLDVCRLRADVDRMIDGLPGLARDLFDLRYRRFVADGRGGQRQRTMQEVCRELRRPWSVVVECHATHFTRMERALRDWFPGGISWRIA